VWQGFLERRIVVSRTVNALFLLLFVVLSVQVAGAENSALPRIEVTATGEVALVPDTAVIDLAVERRAATASEALAQNSTALAAVMKALAEADIAERDIQTSQFSVQPNYVYPRQGEGDRQPRITGYTVRNGLSVRLRDLDRLGVLLEEVVSLGVNQGGNIRFTNGDSDAAVSAARAQAVARAQAKAQALAAAADVQLGRLLYLSDRQPAAAPLPMARAEFAMAADSAVPIAAGENVYQVTVVMVYEISQ
jgi:uncharacterized protein YggE